MFYFHDLCHRRSPTLLYKVCPDSSRAEETRKFYDLERLWNDAAPVPLDL